MGNEHIPRVSGHSVWFSLPIGWRKSPSRWILLLQGSTLWPGQESKCHKPASPLHPRHPSLKKSRTTQQTLRSILPAGVNWSASTPSVSTMRFAHVNRWRVSRRHHECVGLELNAPFFIQCACLSDASRGHFWCDLIVEMEKYWEPSAKLHKRAGWRTFYIWPKGSKLCVWFSNV